jgi:hypothetical protein
MPFLPVETGQDLQHFPGELDYTFAVVEPLF